MTTESPPSTAVTGPRAETAAQPAPNDPAQEIEALRAVARELGEIERSILELETRMRAKVDAVPQDWRPSARNLVHYVALRQHDLRRLQEELARLGLSSLGRAEAWVAGSVRVVSERAREALELRGACEPAANGARGPAPPDWETASEAIHRHTHDILGPRPEDRHIYVMVTAPGADEADRAWMTKMLRAGMNVLRVNCAHEGPEAWRLMARALDEARRETGKECRLIMDLAGPKIRTGPIGGGRHIATWKPSRDDIGKVLAPARVVVRRRPVPGDGGGASALVADDAALALLSQGDVLAFDDARGKRRKIVVREIGRDELVCHADRRAYVLDEVTATVLRDGREIAKIELTVTGAEGGSIPVKVGDELVVTDRAGEGRAPRYSPDGTRTHPGVVSCTLPEALDELDVGQRILFDDGAIEAVVRRKGARSGDFVLEVARTKKPVVKLRAEKGINLPDTPTHFPALTADDVLALPVVAELADAVSLSFVKRPSDIKRLRDALDELGRVRIGLVLKIETRAGFENLPKLLLEGMRRPPLAVMIARGDLAVEAGFERLAELQEEILWLAEASHVPAIWATEVLDTLARTGVPSRAEVTDAAASVAAECVMLNKGPFIDEAVRVLTDILRRMEKHRYKKRSLYRKLAVSTFAANEIEERG